MRKVHFGLVWLLIASLLALGCGTSRREVGTLEVQVWDHREAIGDFSELWLTFSSVAIHKAGQPRTSGWVKLEPSIDKLDLTRYVNGRKKVLAQVPVETGTYNAVRLTIDHISGILADGQPVVIKSNLDPVALNFRIRNDRTTVLGLDLVVLDLGDHSGRGYELHLREGVLLPEEPM